MRSFPILLALAACQPVDTERVRVRGAGMLLEVEARGEPEPVHARRFELSVDPPAAVSLRCEGAQDDTHEHRFARAGHSEWTLFGLLADTAYDCRFTAERDGRQLVGRMRFQTDREDRSVPAFSVTRTGEPWGSYTVFNTWLTGDGGQDHQLVIVDDRGRVRWRWPLDDDTSVGLEARWLDGRSLLIGGGRIAPQRLTLGGETLWKLPALAGDDRFWHHEASLTPQGTILGLHAEPNTNGQRTWEGFQIVEWDPVAGAERWSWSSQRAFDQGLLPLLPGKDPWHANAVQWIDDGSGSTVSLSLPHLDRILGIDPETDALRWSLGRGLDFAMLDGDWFSGQHDPEWSGSRLLLHDNGTAVGSSWALELEIDLEARTAEVVWSWSEPGWFEPLWGDADRLPDGSVLVTRGHCGFCPDAGSGDSSITVVDPSGDPSWQLSLPTPEWGLYRADRIDGCDLFDNTALCEGN